MNTTEQIIYATTFAHALGECRRQALSSNVDPASFAEFTQLHCAEQAAKAVQTFRDTLEVTLYELGDGDFTFELYKEAAEVERIDADEVATTEEVRHAVSN